MQVVTFGGGADCDAMLRSSFGEDVVLLRVRADSILMTRCRREWTLSDTMARGDDAAGRLVGVLEADWGGVMINKHTIGW